MSVITSRPFYFQEEFGPRIGKAIISIIPFIILGIYAVIKLRKHNEVAFTGIVAATMLLLVVSFGLWGLYFYDGLTYQAGGANIGLGILLMFSPLYLPRVIPVGLPRAKL